MKDKICEMYRDGVPVREIIDTLGTSSGTVYRTIEERGVEHRGKGGSNNPNYREDMQMYHDTNGYEFFKDRDSKEVRVHQLTAIARGANPYKVFSGNRWNVHHRNNCSFDNRPGNLLLVYKPDHMRIHNLSEWVEDDGWPILREPEDLSTTST